MGDKYTVKSDLSVAAKHATAIGSANNHSAITVQRDEQRQLLVIIVLKWY